MPSNTASIPMTTTLSCADAALLIINRPTIAPKIYAAPVLGALIPKIRFLITSKRINKTKISIISVAGRPIDCDAKAKAKIKAIAAYSKIGATNPSKKPSINAGGINCAFIYVPLNVQRHSSSRQVFLAALPLATIATNDGIANQQAQIPKRISTEQSQILWLPLLSIAEYLKVERAKIVVGAETTQRLYSQSIYISQVSSHYQKICSKQSVNLFLSNLSERSKPTPTLHARLPQKTPSASSGQARCSSNTAITQGEPSPEARRASPLSQQKLSLDHDHATGEPRGLLHQQCNLKVAQLETHTKKLNYIISRLMLVELALQFRKKHYQLFYAVLSYTEGLLALRCLSWL